MKSLQKVFSLLLCAALLLGCCLIPAAAGVTPTDATPTDAEPETPAVAPAAQGTFSFLSYNVAGLPSLTASSEKAALQQRLGKKVGADHYDIICVQEDFGYDADFAAGLNMTYRTTGQQNAVFGDGLNVFSRTPIYNVAREGWNKKGGMIWEGDIVSQKGVMMTVWELAPGVYVDVYNLHADAFDGQESRDARHDNFMQTLKMVNKYSKDHAVIITGDFNCSFHFTNGEGADMYDIFINQLGMRDAWTDVVNGGSFTDYSAYSGSYWGRWDSVECILYRSSDALTLTPTAHEYIRYQDDDGAAFSDHNAAKAVFSYTANALTSSDGLKPVKKESMSLIKMIQIIIADLKYAFSHFDEVTVMLKYMNDTEVLYQNYLR